MKVMIIGALGQLGSELCKLYGDAVLKVGRQGPVIPLDISDENAVHELLVREVQPNLVINTAAAHNVPKCEQEPAAAFAVNALGARNLARACAELSARLIHVSTDYVFGRGGTKPFVETDLPAPLSVYASSKLAGEHLVAAYCDNHIVVRASAIYGTEPCRGKDGKNFVDLMLHLATTRGEVKVVTDEIVSPTYAGALARQIKLMAEKAEPGLYHATCNGECSWHDFAKAIFDETRTTVTLLEAKASDFPAVVKRPDYSVLQNKRLQDQRLDVMPHWRHGLLEYLAEKEKKARLKE